MNASGRRLIALCCLLLCLPLPMTFACEPYYWVHANYGQAVRHLGLTERKVLRMGLERFTEFHNAAVEKEIHMVPRNAIGDEQAELIYLWVSRQANLRRIARLPYRDRRLLRRLDATLTQMEYCEAALREEETLGGTAWLGYMRRLGQRHEDLLGALFRTHPHWRDTDKKARRAFAAALADLKRTIQNEKREISKHKGDLPSIMESPAIRYRQALNHFEAHLRAFRRVTAKPLPVSVLRTLARYLPGCWWTAFDHE